MTLPLNRRLAVFAFLSLLVTMPSVVLAQTASAHWPGLSTSDLQTVYLLDRSGLETSGKLLALDPDSVMLLVGGAERRFDMTDVTRIQKRDSLKNGTLIGAAVGAVMGLVAAGISDCPGADPGGSCGGVRTATFAASLGMYTGLGAGIDALIRGRTTVYAAAAAPPTGARALAPPPRIALHVGFSWR
jgi:hypothetical protein